MYFELLGMIFTFSCPSELNWAGSRLCAAQTEENVLVGYRCDQRAVLVSDRNRDQRWTFRFQRCGERFLDLLLGFGQHACAAKAFRSGYDVQAGKVQGGDIWRFLQNSKFFED